jgi:alpha-L-rhamnosidase
MDRRGGHEHSVAALRHEFSVKPGLKRALVNICGLGQYELTLNGKKVGDDFLSPGWSKYNKTCLYDTRDITDLLRGKNAIGIELGNGMYNLLATRFVPSGGRPYSFGPQKAIAQIRLEYADGSVETIGTDENWRVAPGPITSSRFTAAKILTRGSCKTAGTKSISTIQNGRRAMVVNGPGGELRGLSCAAPPIREFEIHKPVSSRTFTNGDVFSISARTPRTSRKFPSPARRAAGAHHSVRTRRNDGSADQISMGVRRGNAIWCDFTKATDGVETWSPKFFYVGCRYFEVKFIRPKGETKLPAVKSIEGVVVQSSSEPVGEFECSNPLFNRIRTLVRWAQRAT